MSDEYLEPITPEIDEPENNTNKIIIAVVIAVVVLCCCLCLCVLILASTFQAQSIGNVFSDIEYQLMLTPIL
jgi:hypothetical protein